MCGRVSFSEVIITMYCVLYLEDLLSEVQLYLDCGGKNFKLSVGMLDSHNYYIPYSLENTPPSNISPPPPPRLNRKCIAEVFIISMIFIYIQL